MLQCPVNCLNQYSVKDIFNIAGMKDKPFNPKGFYILQWRHIRLLWKSKNVSVHFGNNIFCDESFQEVIYHFKVSSECSLFLRLLDAEDCAFWKLRAGLSGCILKEKRRHGQDLLKPFVSHASLNGDRKLHIKIGSNRSSVIAFLSTCSRLIILQLFSDMLIVVGRVISEEVKVVQSLT